MGGTPNRVSRVTFPSFFITLFFVVCFFVYSRDKGHLISMLSVSFFFFFFLDCHNIKCVEIYEGNPVVLISFYFYFVSKLDKIKKEGREEIGEVVVFFCFFDAKNGLSIKAIWLVSRLVCLSFFLFF